MNSPPKNNVSCFLCGQRSDRCYVMTQYTRVNNGGDIFSVVSAEAI
jgi:hypothetical protein